MNPTPLRHSPLLRAFTLIELLVVIAIISVLMGLLFPAVRLVIDRARRAQAHQDLMSIVAAVKQYHTEYGKFPGVAATETSGDVFLGDPDAKATIDNSALFDTLRVFDRGLNEHHAQNPRRLVFIEARTATDATSPRAGFADKPESKKRGSFYDPWGKQYGVVIDTDSDNTINLAGLYSDFASENAPRVSVGTFSMGKDGKLGTKGDARFQKGMMTSDDVISWQ